MAAAVLLLLACVLTPLGALSSWAKYEIGDTDAYVATTAPLASDPAVRDAVTEAVSAEILKVIDLGPLQPAVETFVPSAVASFTETRAYRSAWTTAVLATHEALQNSLDNGGDGAITIDLAPITERVRQVLVDDGVPFAHRIPVQHTEVTLMETTDLGAPRKALHTLQVAGLWLPIAAVLCATVGVLLARHRRRAVTVTALGTALAAGLLAAGIALARRVALADLPPEVPRDAAATVYDALTASLRTAAWAIFATGLAVALVVALTAWLTGRRLGHRLGRRLDHRPRRGTPTQESVSAGRSPPGYG